MSKGAGIIFVILPHSMIPWQDNAIQWSVIAFVTSFVMPLYFILAGLTYNGEKHRESLRNYAISRGGQLLIPYFAIYIIMMLLFVPLEGSIDTYLTPIDLVFWLLYGAGPPGQPTYLWFLPVLYFGLLIFVAIESVTHTYDPRVKWPLVALFPFLAFWITDVFSPILVPWRLNSVLLAAAFCIIGHEIRRYRGLKSWHTDSRIRDGAILVFLFVFLIPASQYNGFISNADDWLGTNGWLFIVTGTFGTIFIFMLSSLSEYSIVSRKMQFLGVGSQVIYEVHPIFFYLVPLIVSLFGFSATDYATSFALFWPIRFVFALGLSIPFTLLVYRNRLLSLILTGKSET
ncbi:MAG: acyltransferase family protein [Candidatus Thorarchaeota archaeon]